MSVKESQSVDRPLQIAAANRFVRYVAVTYGEKLSTDLGGLEKLDALIANPNARADLLSRDDAGAFVGEALVHEVDGHWVLDRGDLVVSVSFTVTDPYRRVEECRSVPAESFADYCRAGIEIYHKHGNLC